MENKIFIGVHNILMSTGLPRLFKLNVIGLWSRNVPPVDLVYKVNVDGVVFSSQKQARIGVIIRDSQEAKCTFGSH